MRAVWPTFSSWISRCREWTACRCYEAVKDIDADLPVIMITGYADIPGAVKAIKAGAHDYLAKPFDHADVMRVMHRALAERELKLKLKALSLQVEDQSDPQEDHGTQ